MPVKKTVAKKTATRTAKKTTASASKPLSKEVRSAKKTTKPKPAPEPDEDFNDDEELDALAELLVTALKEGDLDGALGKIDDAVTERINRHNAEQRKQAAKKTAPAEKRVSAPPKKQSVSASVEKPVKNTTYVIRDAFKKLAGAKVKFIHFKPNTDNEKIVIEMMSDKPGNPKGKRLVVPLAAIEEVKKPAAKKGPRRK